MGLKDLKPNVPKVNIAEYTFIIAGLPKIGKTTLLYEIGKDYLKDLGKLLLIACEKGYKALPGIIAQDAPDWASFVEAVDELVDDRDELSFKLVGVDTIDKLVEHCGKTVLREHNSANPSNRLKDANDIPFGKGHEKIKVKIDEQLNRIINAGYGLVIITHSQEKKIKQQDGVEYDQLMPSLPGKTGTAVQNMADFILFITTRKTKSGDTVREIHWRNDGYISAGGRFTNVPETTEFSLEKFVETFEGAVKGAFGDSKVDLKKLEKEQIAEREESAKEFSDKEKNKSTPEAVKAQIQNVVNDMDKPQKKALANKYREKFDGEADFNTFEDVEQLQQALQIAQEIVAG